MKTANPSPARAAKALSHRHPVDRPQRAVALAASALLADRGDQPRPSCSRAPARAPRARLRRSRDPNAAGHPDTVPSPATGAKPSGPVAEPSDYRMEDFRSSRAGDAARRAGALGGRGRRHLEQERRHLHRRLPASAKASGSARRHLLARAGPSQHRGRPVAAKRRLWRALAGHGRVFPPAARDACRRGSAMLR